MRIPHTLATILFAAAASSAGAAEPAPTIQTILASHARAAGPADSIKSRRLRMRLIGAAPFEIPVMTEAARPKLLRKEVTLQGSTQVTAFDGKQGWKTDPFVPGGDKPMSLAGAEAQALAGEADFDGILVNPAAKGIKLAYGGPAQVNGKPAHTIKATLANGETTTVWLDAATWLEVKRTQRGLVGPKMELLDTYMSDYRDIGGIKFPHRIESGLAGARERVTIVMDKVELNVPLDAARFARPAAK